MPKAIFTILQLLIIQYSALLRSEISLEAHKLRIESSFAVNFSWKLNKGMAGQ